MDSRIVVARALLALLCLTVLLAPNFSRASTADELFREAIELRKEGRYREAVGKAQSGIDEARRAGLKVEKPWAYASYLHQLGTLYIQVNDFANASAALHEALEIRKTTDVDAAAETSNALGKLYQDMGRLEEAEPLLVEVARRYEEKFASSPDPVDRAKAANALNTLGAFYREVGKFEAAEHWLKKGLQLRADLPEEQRAPYVASSKFQLAALYRDEGKYRTAETLAREAVEIYEPASKSTGGEGNRQLLASALLLHADVLRAEGRLQEAEEQARSGIEIRKSEFGSDSLRVASGLNVLGAILEARERLLEAEEAYREAFKIRSGVLPADHPDLATSQARLGALLKATDRLVEAEPLLERALAIREKKIGLAHPDTVKSLDMLGDLMRRSGRAEKARELFQKADPYRKSSVQQIRVLFGTNRKEVPGESSVLRFGRTESESRAPTVGIAEVLVPDARTSPRTASMLASAMSLKASERTSPEGITNADHMNIREVEKRSPDELVSAARSSLREAQVYAGKALVFLHGFNTNFNDALIRAAQLAYDLEFDGPVFAFSWPSKGGESLWDHVANVFNYTPDRTSAANARIPFAQFLRDVLLRAEPSQLAIIAHSMGNRLLLETLRDATRTPEDGIAAAIGDLVFAAPDVPRSEFKSFMQELRGVGVMKTLYATGNDRALKASRRFWREAPAGLIEGNTAWWQFWQDAQPGEPVSAAAVEAIDVSKASSSGPLDFLSMNHDLYATNPALVEDMRRLIQSSLHPPHERNSRRFVRKRGANGDYWVFRLAEN